MCLALASTYQVIVEEDRPKKLKRELGGQECFPVPLTFDDAVSRGSVHYFGAELPASSLTEAKPFTVGDNQTYSGYWNPPLEPKKAYLIYFQAMSNLKGVSSRGTPLSSRRAWGPSWIRQEPSWGLGGESEKTRLVPLWSHPGVLPWGSCCSGPPSWHMGVMDGCPPSSRHPGLCPSPSQCRCWGWRSPTSATCCGTS